MARGTVPDSHELNLGMPGMHGTVAAVTSLQRSDLLITLGASFDDRVTGQLSTFAPGAKVIHADIDPAEISKNRIADVPIVGDVGEVITDLIAQITLDRATASDDEDTWDFASWRETVADWKATFPLGYTDSEDGTLSPQYVIERIGALSGPRRPMSPGSASTRCGRRSSFSTNAPTPGSTQAALAPWASRCRRPWGPRWPSRSAQSGRSTATAASR